MAEKLLKYRDLLVEQLNNDPYDTGAWVSLGLQYLNDDDFDNAEKCFDNGVKCAGTSFLPFKEYALHCIRKGLILLMEAHKRTNPSHAFHQNSAQMIKIMNSWNLGIPIVDTGGISISETTVLPEFPDPQKIIDEHLEKEGENNEDIITSDEIS